MHARNSKWLFGAVVLAIGIVLYGQSVEGNAHPGQSVDVVIIGGAALDLGKCAGFGPEANNMGATGGGCLAVDPVVDPALGAFTFAAMTPPAISAASLAPFDTAVLNMASSGMACNSGTLTASQQADLVAFVGNCRKLIIFDSECPPVDYSWLPFPFTTSNPGALGQTGTLTIVEDNLLSTEIASPDCVTPAPLNPVHCIDVVHLGGTTDAVGDMNVMTTFDPNWCIDMSGTNAIGVTGPVHTYANFPSGTDNGLIIYNGSDQNWKGFGVNDAELRQIWVQELEHPFCPSNLPCRVTVVGITLDPPTGKNFVGASHTVTATLTDQLGNPQQGILVTFTVTSGPNAGTTSTTSGVASPANSQSDANGEVSWTYGGTAGAGTDEIEACFTNQGGNLVCSQLVAATWNRIPLEACCLKDKGCVAFTPDKCLASGGSPQGPGTQCAEEKEACCFQQMAIPPPGTCARTFLTHERIPA